MQDDRDIPQWANGSISGCPITLELARQLHALYQGDAFKVHSALVDAADAENIRMLKTTGQASVALHEAVGATAQIERLQSIPATIAAWLREYDAACADYAKGRKQA